MIFEEGGGGGDEGETSGRAPGIGRRRSGVDKDCGGGGRGEKKRKRRESKPPVRYSDQVCFVLEQGRAGNETKVTRRHEIETADHKTR